MPDPPPYGFHPNYLPYVEGQQMGGNAPPNYSYGVELSYPMPMPTAPTIPAEPMGAAEEQDSRSDECYDAPCQLHYSMYAPIGYCWQSLTIDDPFPVQNAVRAGKDDDGSNIYVGRAFHEGDMIPAKVIPEKNVAYVGYGGEEILKHEFEILRSGDFAWEFASDGAIPEGAIEVGRTSDGEKLYMGRCLFRGTQTPGKVHPSHGCLYIPFDGQEIRVNEYEVLVVK